MAKQEGGCDGSCACMRVEESRPSRRSFLKVASVAVGGFLAGCASLVRPETPTATSAPSPTPTNTQPAGKKVLYIIPKDGFAYGCHILSESVLLGNGVTLAYASWTMDPVPAGGTLPPIQPTLLVEKVNVADFDAIIYECGSPTGLDDPQALRIAREAAAANKILGAICMMAAVLASAGVLKGKKATVNADQGTVLEKNGAIYTKADAERDGQFITASYEGRAKFGPMIAAALKE